MAEKRLYKKYTNRRLYDTEKSAYVTLDDITQMIRQGQQVKVIDAKTQEDVTAFILTQIILEESRKKNHLLTLPLLHLIIQYGENALSEFFEKYLEQTIRNYLSYKAITDDQFKKWLDLGVDLSTLTENSLTGLTPLKSFFDLFSQTDKQREKEE